VQLHWHEPSLHFNRIAKLLLKNYLSLAMKTAFVKEHWRGEQAGAFCFLFSYINSFINFCYATTLVIHPAFLVRLHLRAKATDSC